ncbi:hypothetical protein P3T76_003989 [Phytophthora citrophthora]|uniref:BZIP domain-containing protein n=1 Tax=Phytophthora citrophthora TaxID=4793 RepID=A0AAD9LQY3_9STRA|nr:hypothetical protein P3T76_003989 [Phytophthora citrophthora]
MSHSPSASMHMFSSDDQYLADTLGHIKNTADNHSHIVPMSASEELLDPLELMALPPLSPTMERAFSEAFADMSELEKTEDAAVIKLERPSEDLHPQSDDDALSTKKHAASSPSPALMASASHNQQKHKSEIRNMSPSGSKKKDSAEAKRARRSAIEKKSRQRRQNILKRMRDEVKQLEDLYAEVARQKETGGPIMWQGFSLAKLTEGYSGESSSMDELQQKYSELTLVAHGLEEDQEALQKLLHQHEEFQKTVRSLSDEDMEERNYIWDTGVPPSLSFKANFKKLTMTECYALVRDTYEEIQRFNNGHFETTGANFMGWTDKRKYNSRTGALQYGFTKTFPLESPEGLLIKTWEMFMDGPKFKHMSFDRNVNMRYEVLQQMNDDLVIVRRDHRIPKIETTFATIQVIFRLQTPSGYTLCMRTIPSPEIQGVQDPNEYFYEVFHWTHFNRLYDDHGNPAGCELIAAGSIEDQNQLKSTYWLFELVCSILRWETAAMTMQDERNDNVPLDPVEVEALPPLSPTMQRAFLEVFGDEQVSDEEEVSLRQCDASPAQWTSLQVSAAVSPSLEAMTAPWQESLTTMSPSEMKGSADDSPEAKRARRSAIEKKSRQRRQNVLSRMRQEVKQLENVYNAMAKKQEADAKVESSVNIRGLQHNYSQLSLVTQALEEDRVKMLKLLESHEVFQRTAEAMATRGTRRRGALESEKNENDYVWDTGVPPSSSFQVQIRQRSPAECYELVRETYETIKRFDDGGHFVSTGANFMGWTDKRKYDETQALQYGFAKTFPLESAEGLLMQTWNVFCHADTMAHLSFNASVTTRFQIVQKLGDDLCIIRRDHTIPNLPLNFVTVHIAFRLQTPTGYTLCMRTVPAPELKDALEPHEFYYDVFHWTHFNHAVDEDGRPAGCEISTGGYIADVKQLVSKYWLFELVMSVLRWENMCVAPLFLKFI